jgi:hypothetical protein
MDFIPFCDQSKQRHEQIVTDDHFSSSGFIKDFSKITKPLTHLFQKDVSFDFDEKCLAAFRTLKSVLVSAPIIQPLDWSQPFEIMCDASDYAVGAVLGQRKEGRVHAIYYASKTLNEAQLNYATM